MSGRYDTTSNPEDEYYPGTDVLVNAGAIRDADELLERETELFVLAYVQLCIRFATSFTPTSNSSTTFTAKCSRRSTRRCVVRRMTEERV